MNDSTSSVPFKMKNKSSMYRKYVGYFLSDIRTNMCRFKLSHKNVRIWRCTDGSHCATFYLEKIDAVENEIIKS